MACDSPISTPPQHVPQPAPCSSPAQTTISQELVPWPKVSWNSSVANLATRDISTTVLPPSRKFSKTRDTTRSCLENGTWVSRPIVSPQNEVSKKVSLYSLAQQIITTMSRNCAITIPNRD